MDEQKLTVEDLRKIFQMGYGVNCQDARPDVVMLAEIAIQLTRIADCFEDYLISTGVRPAPHYDHTLPPSMGKPQPALAVGDDKKAGA